MSDTRKKNEKLNKNNYDNKFSNCNCINFSFITLILAAKLGKALYE